jgi:hypothetical protein
MSKYNITESNMNFVVDTCDTYHSITKICFSNTQPPNRMV